MKGADLTSVTDCRRTFEFFSLSRTIQWQSIHYKLLAAHLHYNVVDGSNINLLEF